MDNSQSAGAYIIANKRPWHSGLDSILPSIRPPSELSMTPSLASIIGFPYMALHIVISRPCTSTYPLLFYKWSLLIYNTPRRRVELPPGRCLAIEYIGFVQRRFPLRAYILDGPLLYCKSPLPINCMVWTADVRTTIELANGFTCSLSNSTQSRLL